MGKELANGSRELPLGGAAESTMIDFFVFFIPIFVLEAGVETKGLKLYFLAS